MAAADRLRRVETERRLLQIAVALAACVPVAGGLAGIVGGSGMLGPASASADLDSHVRYLSGLLLGIGLTFWSLVPRIEASAVIFRCLTAIVVIGGVARLYGAAATGWPAAIMMFALVMELAVTPLLCIWQARIARLNRS